MHPLDVTTINTNEELLPHGHLNDFDWESSFCLAPLSPILPITHSSVNIFDPTCIDAICAALTWSELGSYPQAIHNDLMLSNISFYNLTMVIMMTTWSLNLQLPLSQILSQLLHAH